MAEIGSIADSLPQHDAVIEYHIDAHQLLKCGKTDTHPDNFTPFARKPLGF